jgi:hypothetical protein
VAEPPEEAAGAAPEASDASDAGPNEDAGQSAATPKAARVIIPGQSIVERPREGECGKNHAACHPGACFRTGLENEHPKTPASLLRCERDVDCAGTLTRCPGREGIDGRAVRADSVERWEKQLCGAPAEQSPDAASLTVACVQGACRTVVPLAPDWCDPSRRTYTIVDGRETITRPVHDECAGYSFPCPSPGGCYSVDRPASDRPSLDMARCRDDAECIIVPGDCCGGVDRAIRKGAKAQWKGAHPCPSVVTCPAVVHHYPGEAACVAGRCELLQATHGPACSVAATAPARQP